MKPIEEFVGGKRVTYGFECEFRAGPKAYENVINSNGDNLSPKLTWIVKKISKEKSGNTEIRSVVSNDLIKQLNRMKKLKQFLGKEMRGFHIHFRVGMDIFKNDLVTNNILGWLGRFGDMILLWRLQYFNPKWALSQWSQIRSNTDWLRGNDEKFRGVIRTFKINGSFDIEIRGLMANVDMFYKCVSLVINRLQNPEMLSGNYDWQSRSMKVNNQEKLTHFVTRYTHQALSNDEKMKLDYLELYATPDEWKHPKRGAKTKHGKCNIPLFGFDDAPFFDVEVKNKINKANKEFCNNLMINVNKNLSEKELVLAYHTEMKKWARKIDLFQELYKTL